MIVSSWLFKPGLFICYDRCRNVVNAVGKELCSVGVSFSLVLSVQLARSYVLLAYLFSLPVQKYRELLLLPCWHGYGHHTLKFCNSFPVHRQGPRLYNFFHAQLS